ncbi:MAG: hypothetical protein ACLQPH_00780 [Acidimicrobiales bacterium]
MNRAPVPWWTGFVFVCLGLFGVAFAISGLMIALPTPAAGGTCGPGKGSEAAIIALFDPVTIGAGPEPPASAAADRAQWSEFVHDCQTAADDRALAAFPILIVSVAVAVVGPLVARRRARRRLRPTPEPTLGGWPPPPWSTLPSGIAPGGMAPTGAAPSGMAPTAVHELLDGVPGATPVGTGAPLPPPPVEPPAGT